MKIEIEKPIIPQFVTDWIESLYDEGGEEYDPIGVMFDLTVPVHKVDRKVHEWFRNNKREYILSVLFSYEIEQTLYYAKIKGWENKYLDGPFYWNHITFAGGENKISIADYAHEGSDIYAKTKAEWNELGINETNADFVKEEDL